MFGERKMTDITDRFKGCIAYFNVEGDGHYVGKVTDFGDHYLRISPYVKVRFPSSDDRPNIDEALKELKEYSKQNYPHKSGRNMLLSNNTTLMFLDDKIQDKE